MSLLALCHVQADDLLVWSVAISHVQVDDVNPKKFFGRKTFAAKIAQLRHRVKLKKYLRGDLDNGIFLCCYLPRDIFIVFGSYFCMFHI